MPDVVLIRPGCTDFDEQHRIQGSLDLPLSPRGREQVELVVRQLKDLRLDVIYSAPCEPARSTAIAICDECGATFKETADFSNLNHGLWQGLQVDDVRRKYPKVYKQWQESPETVCLPQGETVDQAIERIEHGLRKCLKRKRNIGIVASEPLATLIGCVLRGCRPELPDAAACCQPERQIEVLHLSQDDGVRSVVTSGPTNGADTNGKPLGRDLARGNGQKEAKDKEAPKNREAADDHRLNGAAGTGSGTAELQNGQVPATAPRREPQ